MPHPITLAIRQHPPVKDHYPIRLTLKRPTLPDLEGEAKITFALTPQEQEDLRWYMEDYLQHAESTETAHIAQIEAMIRARGEELYDKVLAANLNTQAIWFAIREQLADLRIEITTGIAEAAAIPWELMRDPASDSALAVRVKAFVRVQSNPNISFVQPQPAADGRIRLLYVVCRPDGRSDVALRAIANRLLQGLTEHREGFDIVALRPPTFEQLQKTLTDAKEAGRPFHIVHFDGHGVYADLGKTTLAAWLGQLSSLMLGGKSSGKHGYLLFEHPGSDENIRPVSGAELGKLLHDTGVPLLVLNACQSAMHEATEQPADATNVHDEVRAIGSLAQAVVDQGIPAVLGMRYSVFVVTAAQLVGELYAGLAKGREFGQAASEARKHLQRNPERWVGLQPRPLQDWFVPVIFEAAPLALLPSGAPKLLADVPELDPVQLYPELLRHVPEIGFIGRDETLLLLDRAFDTQSVVLLHAYAGQGKTSTAVEFARWYAQTGGLSHPKQALDSGFIGVLLTSFERHTDLTDALNQVAHRVAPLLQARGIEWHAINDANQRRQQILRMLREVPVLWVWDNVEPVAGFPEGANSAWAADEQQELRNFLHLVKQDKATKAKILLTSRRDERRWLGGIPFRIAMPQMSDDDAAKLVLAFGQERGWKATEIADWAPLLDYCAGNPLTLRVVAGQAVQQNMRGRERLTRFVQELRDGETEIADADAAEGRDKSLGASLDYGFRHAFTAEELPVVALLHLFQGVVDGRVLLAMGEHEDGPSEVKGKAVGWLAQLLNRTVEIGLLTELGKGRYELHPALPWFLSRIFQRYYKGSFDTILRAWTECVSVSGVFYLKDFSEGNIEAIQLLTLEEANYLQARRIAHQRGWWGPLISAMQGIRQLYSYQGRQVEWSRLVAEITPTFCTPDNDPVDGYEDAYGTVMSYQVDLARKQKRDFALAASLQEKTLAWDRKRASEVLDFKEDTKLDILQSDLIRNVGVNLMTLGQILSEQKNCACIFHFEEAIQLFRRIGDNAAESSAHFNLGHVYKDLSTLHDLNEAESCYKRSMELINPDDHLTRSKCLSQLGSLHQTRFEESRNRGESKEILINHIKAAEECYLKALSIRPDSAEASFGPLHAKLGDFYGEFGLIDRACHHYQEDIRISEKIGDRHSAGISRYNLSITYAKASENEETSVRRRDLLVRAYAYALAALKDFQFYKGRARDWESDTEQLISDLKEDLDGI